MQHYYNRAGFARALALDLDPRLHELLAERIGALTEDLIDYTEYLIVEPGDTEADIIRHIGFSPLIEPIDGALFGENGFHIFWDWAADVGGYFELIFTFGSSYACVILAEDNDACAPPLITLCRTNVAFGLK